MADSRRRFTTTVRIDGTDPYVDVPDDVAGAIGDGARVPVLVDVAAAGARRDGSGRRVGRDADRLVAIGRLTADGRFRTSLLRSPSRPVRLYLDGWMRDAAAIGVGDDVRITLERDDGSRELPLPDRLAEALAGDPGIAAAWSSLAPSRRREILSYVGFLKSEAAVERNVAKVVADLRRQAPE